MNAEIWVYFSILELSNMQGKNTTYDRPFSLAVYLARCKNVD